MIDSIWKPEEVEAAITAAKTWRGTPHKNRVAIKGKGVDCIKFCLLVCVEAGFLQQFKFPKYDTNIGRRGAEDIIMKNLDQAFYLMRLSGDIEPQDGDLCVFRADFSCNHVGIYLKKNLWQCLWNRTVEPYPYQDWRKHVHTIMRWQSREFKIDPEAVK
jgi:cell wall-associated NlpC family hydrolase